MIVTQTDTKFEYIAETGDWRIRVGDGLFQILPQVGGYEYESGTNLENLANLILFAKQHALENNVNWENN